MKNSIVIAVVIMIMLIAGGYYRADNSVLKANDTAGSVPLDCVFIKNEIIKLTNEERKAHGLSILLESDQLNEAAGKKAEDMFQQNYWKHISPGGKTPWQFIKESGYQYLFAGENLARGYITAKDTVLAWMESPGHRDNILNADYNEIGVAVKTGILTGNKTVLSVQEFGCRKDCFKEPPITITISPSPAAMN